MLNLLFDDTEDSEDYSVASTPNKCKEESSNRTKTDDTFPKNNKTNLENVKSKRSSQRTSNSKNQALLNMLGRIRDRRRELNEQPLENSFSQLNNDTQAHEEMNQDFGTNLRCAKHHHQGSINLKKVLTGKEAKKDNNLSQFKLHTGYPVPPPPKLPPENSNTRESNSTCLQAPQFDFDWGIDDKKKSITKEKSREKNQASVNPGHIGRKLHARGKTQIFTKDGWNPHKSSRTPDRKNSLSSSHNARIEYNSVPEKRATKDEMSRRMNRRDLASKIGRSSLGLKNKLSSQHKFSDFKSVDSLNQLDGQFRGQFEDAYAQTDQTTNLYGENLPMEEQNSSSRSDYGKFATLKSQNGFQGPSHEIGSMKSGLGRHEMPNDSVFESPEELYRKNLENVKKNYRGLWQAQSRSMEENRNFGNMSDLKNQEEYDYDLNHRKNPHESRNSHPMIDVHALDPFNIREPSPSKDSQTESSYSIPIKSKTKIPKAKKIHEVNPQLRDDEILEDLILVFNSEPVKTEIIKSLLKGPRSTLQLVRKIKKTRYIGSVTLGIIMYNLIESFGSDMIQIKSSAIHKSYYLSPRFEALCKKALKKPN